LNTGQGEGEELLDALANTVAEQRPETIIEKRLKVKIKRVINTLADTDAK